MKTELPVVLTPTRTESGDACYRKHVISDILEYGKQKGDALSFGNVMHGGVSEVHRQVEYNGLDRFDAAVYDAANKVLAAEYERYGLAGDSEKYTLEKANITLASYIEGYQRVGSWDAMPDAKWKVLTVEDRVRLPINGVVLSFQIDRAFQDVNAARFAVIDLKTVTNANAEWKAKWYRALQMQLYKVGFKHVYGVDYDSIFFGIEGLDKNKKPKLHYVPLPMWSEGVLDEALGEFLRMADRDDKLIRSALDSDGKTINVDVLETMALTQTSFNRNNCFEYHSQCEFYDLCHNTEPDMRRGLLHAEYEQHEAEY